MLITARSACAVARLSSARAPAVGRGFSGEPVDGVRRRCWRTSLRAAGCARSWSRPGSRSAPLAMAFRRTRPGGPDPAARADRRALGLVHRPGAGEGGRSAGRGGVHIGDGGGELPPGRHRGRRVGLAAAACSPPTGRRNCAAPGPARPSTRSSCTVPRSAGTPSQASPSGFPQWPATGVHWPAAPGRTRQATSDALPGPVHLNIPLRDPLVPDAQPPTSPAEPADAADWPDSLDGRADDAPWTRTRRPGRRRGTAGAAVGRAGRGGVRRRRLRRCRAGRTAPAGGLADAGRAVVGGAARAERPRRLPAPARLARVHGGAPADRHHLGRPAGADPPAVGAAPARPRNARPRRSGTS